MLTDFGSAAIATSKSLVTTRFGRGTECYRAPEVIHKNQYNNRVDMFALGCIIFKVITGQMLFSSDWALGRYADTGILPENWPPSAPGSQLEYLGILTECLLVIDPIQRPGAGATLRELTRIKGDRNSDMIEGEIVDPIFGLETEPTTAVRTTPEVLPALRNIGGEPTKRIQDQRNNLNAMQLENESAFLRSIALAQNAPTAPSPPTGVMPSPYSMDANLNSFPDWPVSYEGMSYLTQSSVNDFYFPTFNAYKNRVPEVQSDQKHLNNLGVAPHLAARQHRHHPYESPTSPRLPQQQDTTKEDTTKQPPVGAESLGNPGLVAAIAYLYDYIVKQSPLPPGPPPQQP
jgi:serine/threonine protein kinase